MRTSDCEQHSDLAPPFVAVSSEGDTIDKVSEKELGECIATLAIMAYLAADFPDPLGVPLAGGS